MISTHTCTILASDFSDSTADSHRTHWTVGKMVHVIAALKDVPVVITTDRQSGSTEIGVQLVGAFEGGATRGPRVTVRRTFEDGTTMDTNYYMWSIGEAIIPLERGDGAGVKWEALKSYREQKSLAIRTAQAEHGEREGRAWGSWKAEPMSATEVFVSYEPHTGNPAFADQWGSRWYGVTRPEIPATV